MKRNRDADNLSHRLDRAANIIPQALHHLDAQRHNTITATARGEGGRQAGTHSDPTLRTILNLDPIEHRRQAIHDTLHTVTVAVRLLEQAIHDAYRNTDDDPGRASDGEPVCKGGDASTWGDPECGELTLWQITDNGHIRYHPEGLCPKHLARQLEWQHRADESNGRRQRRHRENVA